MEQQIRESAKKIFVQELRKALAAGNGGGIEIVYQPFFHVAKGEVIGAEALIRWNHPLLGEIPPRFFVSYAEENGLISVLDRYVLTVACTQMKRWQDNGYGPIRIAVNISPLHFRQANFVKVIGNVLQETGLPPECLEIELTENTAIRHETMPTFGRLKQLGIRISIDDFGTGYSSLNYLRVFPVDTLKIDQVFIKDIQSSRKEAPITSFIIRLAHELNLHLVAEGVETEEQKNYLLSRNCPVMQGFLFSRPLSSDQFEQLLQTDNTKYAGSRTGA